MKILERLFGKQDYETNGKTIMEMGVDNRTEESKVEIDEHILPLILFIENNEASSYQPLTVYGGTTISFVNGSVRIDVNRDNTYIYSAYYTVRKFCNDVEDLSGHIYLNDKTLTESARIRLTHSFQKKLEQLKQKKVLTTLETVIQSFESGVC